MNSERKMTADLSEGIISADADAREKEINNQKTASWEAVFALLKGDCK